MMLRCKLSGFLVVAAVLLMNSVQALELDDSPNPQYPVLILDDQNHIDLPNHYRSSLTAFPASITPQPSRLGLETLKASGSAEFNKQNFSQIINHIGDHPIIFVDLRKESHGFLNEIPISWYGFQNWENKDRTPKEVDTLEKKLLQRLNNKKQIIAYQKKSVEEKDTFIPDLISYNQVLTEQQFVKNLNSQYKRFYILDHAPPEIDQIDSFVQFVEKTPENTWLHFHCRTGKGRTTTFLVLYDIIRNAKQVKFNDIIKRHALIGGENILETTKNKLWKVMLKKRKSHLIEAFYQYVTDPNGYRMNSFSAWLEENKPLESS